jgi:hypothetical protein
VWQNTTTAPTATLFPKRTKFVVAFGVGIFCRNIFKKFKSQIFDFQPEGTKGRRTQLRTGVGITTLGRKHVH